MFSLLINEQIQKHAMREYPRESVGAVLESKKTGEVVYRELDNTAANPEEEFFVERKVIVSLSRSYIIRALVHSHPLHPGDKFDELACPSKADMESQIAWKFPFGICVSTEDSCSKVYYWGGDTPIPSLVGREFVHGIQDCYSLIRDYYRTKLDIVLPEFPRDAEWWNPKVDERGNRIKENDDLYMDNFATADFSVVPLDSIKEHDVILWKIWPAKVVNHAVVYLGGDSYLHHLTGTYSKEETGVYRHQKLIFGALRHISQMEKNDE